MLSDAHLEAPKVRLAVRTDGLINYIFQRLFDGVFAIAGNERQKYLLILLQLVIHFIVVFGLFLINVHSLISFRLECNRFFYNLSNKLPIIKRPLDRLRNGLLEVRKFLFNLLRVFTLALFITFLPFFEEF